jgi:hypothetical protein
MEYVLGAFAGMAAIILVQAARSGAARVRCYEIDGRGLVEFMHRSRVAHRGDPAATALRAPREVPLPEVRRGVCAMSPGMGTRTGIGTASPSPRLRIVHSATIGNP